MLNVTNAQNVQYAFSTPPQGLTPLVPKLREILAAKRDQSYEKNLVILIATDGYASFFYNVVFAIFVFLSVHRQIQMVSRILPHWKVSYVMSVHH